MIAPIFDKLSIEYPNISFIKIDVDQLADTAQNYRIQSVPTFMFFKGQEKMSEFPGADEGNLKKQLISLESL
jgi:thioredoxin 1